MASFRKHRSRNLLQTAALTIGLWLPLLLVADRLQLSLGWTAFVVGCGVISSWGALRWSGPLVLRRLGAVPLDERSSSGLRAAVDELARRADLDHRPQLFLIATSVPNAFATTWPGGSAIALTEGLLRRLNGAELVAVLAHEVAHVRHRDLYVLALADLAVRFTSALAMLGWLIAFLQLPLLLFGVWLISPLQLLALLLAPRCVELLRLALSRTREFDADLEAARLTAQPGALASALRRLQGPRRSLWMRVLFPGPEAVPTYLRTHPSVEARIRRLQSLLAVPRSADLRAELPVRLALAPNALETPLRSARRPRTVWQIVLR